MNIIIKYQVKYYFTKDLYVTKIIEAETPEDATRIGKEKGQINFTDSKGVFYDFHTDDMILISVSVLNVPSF